MAKIVPKRTTLLQKLAYILRPFVIYMVVKTFVMLFLAVAIPSIPVAGMEGWVERNANQLSAVVNGVASMVAAGFLLNDFLIEVNRSGEIDIDKNMFVQYVIFMRNGFWGEKNAKNVVKLLLCVMLGITASLALNGLIALVSPENFGSEKYGTVKTIQYSVPVWLGILLYGFVSPMVEELVFRGVTYNRMRKFFSVPKAVVFSALLFGLFHANLPQFLYGTAMGILMAVCYEYSGCFAAPVLVHMSANIFVFLMSGLQST